MRKIDKTILMHDANDPNKLARGLAHGIATRAIFSTCYEGEKEPNIEIVEKPATRAWQAYVDAHDLWMHNSNPRYGRATKTEGPEWDALQKAKEELAREMKGGKENG